MGRQNPYTKRLEQTRRMACFLLQLNFSPDLFVVRRDANILNKHAILCDCSEPPGHLSKKWWFFVLYARKTDAEKGNK